MKNNTERTVKINQTAEGRSSQGRGKLPDVQDSALAFPSSTFASTMCWKDQAASSNEAARTLLRRGLDLVKAARRWGRLLQL